MALAMHGEGTAGELLVRAASVTSGKLLAQAASATTGKSSVRAEGDVGQVVGAWGMDKYG